MDTLPLLPDLLNWWSFAVVTVAIATGVWLYRRA
jgi:hypothetical protein